MLQQAIDYFEQALSRDPDYALAWSGLADARARHYDLVGDAPGELIPRIREAAQRALVLDSMLAEPYALLGWTHTHAWEWPEAEAAFERALALDPNDPDTYQDYSIYLDNRGRFEEALEACLFAKSLDPLSPRIAYNVAGSYIHLARFEPAIEEARSMIALNPGLPLGYDALGWALVDSGRPAEAIRPLEQAVTLGDGRWLALANLGRAYAGVGRVADARAVLARLERDWGHTGLGHFAIAAVHLALGEREPALRRLEEVYRSRFAKVPHERQWSAFESLYDDPDFRRIVREAGF
jgi:serine/threonine-protein kinase